MIVYTDAEVNVFNVLSWFSLQDSTKARKHLTGATTMQQNVCYVNSQQPIALVAVNVGVLVCKVK